MNMDKIAIFFGPLGGSVHHVAKKIKNIIGESNVVMVPVKDASAADLEKYDKIIFGISTVGKETWHSTYSNVDWGKFLPEIGKARYEGKTVAIFGLGDHVTYASTFVNHIGYVTHFHTFHCHEIHLNVQINFTDNTQMVIANQLVILQ
jgi:flavodoxin I